MRPSQSLPFSIRDLPRQSALLCLAASVAVVCLSIAASQILLGGSIAAFLFDRWRRPARPYRSPAITWPVLALFTWTVIAAICSPHLWLNLISLKKFLIFLVAFLVPSVMNPKGARLRTYRAVFVAGAVAAAGGLMQYIAFPDRDIDHRITGFMSHWMTFAGLLMLVLVAITSYALCLGMRKSWWTIPLWMIVATGMYMSQTRNTLLGAAAALTFQLILMKRYRAVAGVAGVLVLAYLVSPVGVRHRLLAGFDLDHPHTRPRVELLGTAIRLIRDNPWVGVGPGSVALDALRYRGTLEYPDWTYMHMHNNFLQIAAERGIPGLALWIWLMTRLILDALKRFRHAAGRKLPRQPPEPGAEDLMVSLSALGASVALLVTGLLEYNFGDSEVLTLFLFMACAPYADVAPAHKDETNSR